MINFRFHIVSLIAIFLALALGVVIGAGVIDRGVVNTLNDRLDSVEAKSDRIKGENDKLQDENSKLSGAIGSEQPFAVDGRLVGETTGMIAVRGVDESRVKQTAAAAVSAGAKVPGVLWLEDKWNLTDAGSVKALQDALGVTIKNKTALRTEAWRQLGVRLATPPSEVGGTDDLLATLAGTGFLSYENLSTEGSTTASFPGRGASLVFVTGTTGKVAPELIVVPAAAGIHAASVPLVLADQWVELTDGPTRGAALQPVRDGALGRSVSTVDDLDQPQGPTTVVLAMADLLRIPPVVGHYGYGPGTQPLPDPVAA
jgi:hypothetical protein